MDNFKTNKFGRSYISGKPLSEDFRVLIEVEIKLENPNTTLNLLVSLNGVEYYDMLDGATDTVQFLNFFEEAANAVNFEMTR